MLEIKNLHINIKRKEILKGVSLNLEKGKAHVLMGPNGSGKTSLVHAIMGDPKYKITKGKIIYNKEDITNLKPNKIAQKGIFLSFQYPVEISGVIISNFLRTALNTKRKNKISILEFNKLLNEKADLLKINKNFLTRYLNEGFSGGEKKKAEILQMLVLDPKLAICDETDSGMDLDSLKIVANGINKFMNKEKCILIITHYKRILDYIKPDKLFIMKDGKIVLEGSKEILDKLEEKGYNWIK